MDTPTTLFIAGLLIFCLVQVRAGNLGAGLGIAFITLSLFAPEFLVLSGRTAMMAMQAAGGVQAGLFILTLLGMLMIFGYRSSQMASKTKKKS